MLSTCLTEVDRKILR